MPVARPRPAPRGRAGTLILFAVGVVVWFVAAPTAVGVLTDAGPVALVALAAAQLLGAVLLIGWWLRRHGRRIGALGATRHHWGRDTLVGLATLPPRLVLELWVLVPLAGGAANEGVQEVLRTTAAGWPALAATLVLGVVGGGVAEELYFRGFLVGAVPQVFTDRRRARTVAVVVSVVLFALLHLPRTGPDLISILVAAATYTALFVATGRLTAPVVAHSAWNVVVTLGVLALYG